MRLGHTTVVTIIVVYAIFKLPYRLSLKKSLKPKIPFFGGYSEEVTPVPIPNTEVKLFSADGTAREAWWESRTPPKILYKACHPKDDRLFCFIVLQTRPIN